MSKRMTWIIVLVACGIGAAVVVGVLGTNNEPSKTEAVSSLCTSLKTLESSVETLTSLPSGTSPATYQADVGAVQTAWGQVTTDAQGVQSAQTGELDSAWNNFTAAVKNVPSASSVSTAVSDITQSAQALVSAAQTTASQLNC